MSGLQLPDEDACNFSLDGIEDNVFCDYVALFTIQGDETPFSQTLQEYTYSSTAAGSTFAWSVEGGDILGGDGTNELSVVWNEEGPGLVTVVETSASGCEGEAVTLLVDVTLSSVAEMLNGSLGVPRSCGRPLAACLDGPRCEQRLCQHPGCSGSGCQSSKRGSTRCASAWRVECGHLHVGIHGTNVGLHSTPRHDSVIDGQTDKCAGRSERGALFWCQELSSTRLSKHAQNEQHVRDGNNAISVKICGRPRRIQIRRATQNVANANVVVAV